MPEDAQPPQIGMGALDKRQLDRARRGIARHRLQRLTFGHLHLGHSIFHPPVRRKLLFELLLTDHRRNRPVDAQHLVISCNDFSGTARLAVVEEHKVFDQVEQPVMGQHAVEQPLGFQARRLLFVVALPFDKMLPLTGDRAIPRPMAVADD